MTRTECPALRAANFCRSASAEFGNTADPIGKATATGLVSLSESAGSFGTTFGAVGGGVGAVGALEISGSCGGGGGAWGISGGPASACVGCGGPAVGVAPAALGLLCGAVCCASGVSATFMRGADFTFGGDADSACSDADCADGADGAGGAVAACRVAEAACSDGGGGATAPPNRLGEAAGKEGSVSGTVEASYWALARSASKAWAIFCRVAASGISGFGGTWAKFG